MENEYPFKDDMEMDLDYAKESEERGAVLALEHIDELFEQQTESPRKWHQLTESEQQLALNYPATAKSLWPDIPDKDALSAMVSHIEGLRCLVAAGVASASVGSDEMGQTVAENLSIPEVLEKKWAEEDWQADL